MKLITATFGFATLTAAATLFAPTAGGATETGTFTQTDTVTEFPGPYTYTTDGFASAGLRIDFDGTATGTTTIARTGFGDTTYDRPTVGATVTSSTPRIATTFDTTFTGDTGCSAATFGTTSSTKTVTTGDTVTLSITTSSIAEHVTAGWFQVTSPWGHTTFYWLEPGVNHLHCAGTGRPFDYHHGAAF